MSAILGRGLSLPPKILSLRESKARPLLTNDAPSPARSLSRVSSCCTVPKGMRTAVGVVICHVIRTREGYKQVKALGYIQIVQSEVAGSCFALPYGPLNEQ
jgi:hypothetical protein